MLFHEFEIFVQNNIDLLSGVHPELQVDIEKYEASLGFSLPKSMKWLLSTHGYSRACGIENIEDSIKLTEDCRVSINLPKNILIINDWNDGGVVFAIANNESDADYEIVWADAADLCEFSKGQPIPKENERFKNFAAWVADRVQFERENA